MIYNIKIIKKMMFDILYEVTSNEVYLPLLFKMRPYMFVLSVTMVTIVLLVNNSLFCTKYTICLLTIAFYHILLVIISVSG